MIPRNFDEELIYNNLATSTERLSISATSSNNKVHRFSDPETCLKILRGTTYSDNETLGTNELPLVRSRAIPNQRLVRAFGIDNGFTTFDDKSRAEFRKWAESQLSSFNEARWKETAARADFLVEEYIQRIFQRGHNGLESAVQIVALKLIFEEFFKLDAIRLSDNVMLELAQEINRAWIASKSEAREESGSGYHKFKSLFEKLGLHSDSAKDNPLNTLLPVYETLWRVVTHCIIEVVFRPSAAPEWIPLLENFLKEPSKTNFSARSSGMDGVSVEFLVKEALRLYPPTRRIYRQMHMRSKDAMKRVAADIEACQRLPSIWGHSSHRYHPARWNFVDAEMQKAFMPFGGPPYKCPASSNFGPWMIGVLVAAFALRLRASEWRLELQDRSGVRSEVLDDEMELDTNRSEGASWMLKRRD
ncbi:MAG: hypothetical protein LQ352_005448 [Teloschistes flavicans]|nr:MAG: hypothetical protein LQ352_005448 [Teloschistes flavicans]